jgi:catechol 2,3-dioxygenase-like lactoylglutathione lyase family enzyme
MHNERRPANRGPVSMIESIRISVCNGSSSRHFWESALGLRFVAETEVYDPALRQAWGVAEGSLRLTRLEVAAEIFPKLDLVEWEFCSETPIRDPRHPWDLGLLALRLPVTNLDERLHQIAQWRCPVIRNSAEHEATVFTPGGERVVLREGGSSSALVVVRSLDEASHFFRQTLQSPNGIPPRTESSFVGAASVDRVRTRRLGAIEIIELARSADPRPAAATASRMHPRFTGYCMLSASIEGSNNGTSLVERPFTGPTLASMAETPGGIPVEIFAPSARLGA